MRKALAFVLAASLFTPDSVAAPAAPYSYASGVPNAPFAAVRVPDGKINNPTGGVFPVKWVGTTTIPVYVIWYNHVAVPWTTAEQTLAIEWVNHVSNSPLWRTLEQYTNPSLVSPAGFSLVESATYTDPESEGTDLCTAMGNAVSNAVSGSHLACDTTGLYLVMPSDTDVTFGSSCGRPGGEHAQVTASCGTLNIAAGIRTTGNYLIGDTPNADTGFDQLIYAISHETLEAMTFGIQANATGDEICDICVDGSGGGSNFQISGMYVVPSTGANPGTVANWNFTDSGTRYDFILPDCWNREEGGRCGQAYYSQLRGCSKFSDCQNAVASTAPPGTPLWNQGCLNGHCTQPTCSDVAQDGWETGSDCGATCGVFSCPSGQGCTSLYDCSSHVCLATGLCQ